MKYKIFYSILIILLSSFFGYSQSKKYKKVTDYEVISIYGINTEYNDYSPVLYKDKFVFASDREYDLKTIGEGNWRKTKHTNIFKANFQNIFADSIVLEKVDIFDVLLLQNDHVGPITFNKEGTEAIVTIVTHKETKALKKGLATPQLYILKQEKGKWKTLERLPFNVNKQSFAHPSWSPDEKKLYFSWNKIPGEKASDIYEVERKETGWGEPKKVQGINTKENEMFPYLIDNKIYFASNREGGFGGLDLYVSELENGKWTEPKNLGKHINTEADEFAMIFNVNKSSGYFCSNRIYGKGKDDIFAFNKIDKTIVEQAGIEGQLTFRNIKTKSPEGLEIGLFDENGNLIEKTTVGKDGKFIFKNVSNTNKYKLKVINANEEIELTLFGEKEDVILISDNKGNFIYRKLSRNKVGTLSLIEDGDFDIINNTKELSGQFVFKTLDSKKREGLEVFLIDSEGKIVMQSKTDKYGNFTFKNIPIEGDYTIKSNNDKDYDILVFNKKDELIARLKKDEYGNYIFRKLSSQGGYTALETEEEEVLFLEKRVALNGQFVYVKRKDNVGKLGVEVHNKKEKIRTTKTNKEGQFMSVGLKLSDQYKFKITDESLLKEEPILNITNRYNQTVAELRRDSIGFYVFNKSEDFNLGDSVVQIEVIQIEQTNIQDTSIIFYGNDEFKLTKDDLKILDERIKKMKQDEELFIRIESYASSKGTIEYNKKLTQKRKAKVLQYITSKGIHQSRIKAFSYGKERTQEEQDEEQQRLSRKTELTLFKLK